MGHEVYAALTMAAAPPARRLARTKTSELLTAAEWLAARTGLVARAEMRGAASHGAAGGGGWRRDARLAADVAQLGDTPRRESIGGCFGGYPPSQ